MINYGIRSGGGVGDFLPRVSFYKSPSYFASAFLFYVTFHILIIWIIGNIFLGIIVDTFGQLRDAKELFENDYNNVCFMCQTTRDKATTKHIDFEEHIATNHRIWNYVSFITYLYVNNPLDFNQKENGVYEKIKWGDMSWVPIDYS
jgi:hypothetical protein